MTLFVRTTLAVLAFSVLPTLAWSDDEPATDPAPATTEDTKPDDSTDPQPAADDEKPTTEPADEKPTNEKPGTEPTDTKPDDTKPEIETIDVLAEWDQLRKRKEEIAKELRALKKEFETADSARKRTLRKTFSSLVDEFQLEIGPEMDDFAADVLAKRPEDPEAAAIRMREEFDENHFEKAREFANVVLEHGSTVPYEFAHARRVAAVSNFALHDFAKAAELLADVQHTPGWARYQALEKPFLEPAAKEYVELWKAEQALREKEEALEGDAALPRVKLEIIDGKGEPRGEVEVLLFADQAPNTVASFVETVKSGNYDGTEFHRVIPNFVAQGGRLDPRAEWTIDSEFVREDARKHFRGSLSMAHAGKDTGSSQFFVTVLPTHSLNPEFDDEGNALGGHTVFGRVVKGMDVVDDVEQGDVISKAMMLHERPDMPKPVRKGEPEPATPDGDENPTEDKPGDETPNEAKPLPDDAKPMPEKPSEPKPLPDDDEKESSEKASSKKEAEAKETESDETAADE